MEADQKSTEFYICKKCNGTFLSLDAVPDHDCFGNDEDEDNLTGSKQNQIDLESQTDAEREHKILKQNAVWNKRSTLALLDLYKENLYLADHAKKKTKIWTAITEGLALLGIEIKSDQVRWKINSLLKRYKECVDNNAKSGRSPMTFEYYEHLEDILGHQEEAVSMYTVASIIGSKFSAASSSNKSKKNLLERQSLDENDNTQPGSSINENRIAAKKESVQDTEVDLQRQKKIGSTDPTFAIFRKCK